MRKRVYKERGSFAALGYRTNVHDKVMRDSVRVMARITSLMRSRGVRVPHAGVYSESGRKKWIAGLPEAARYAAEILYAELDALMVLRAHAEKEMVSEARRHAEFRILKSCPGLGSIRAAQLMAVVLRDLAARATNVQAATLPHERSTRQASADVGCKNQCSCRQHGVRLDSLPHRRNFNRGQWSMRRPRAVRNAAKRSS